ADPARFFDEPRRGLGFDDLAPAVGDLLVQHGVLLGQRGHTRLEVAALRSLAVDGERDEAGDRGDDANGKPALRRAAAGGDGGTARDDRILSATCAETNERTRPQRATIGWGVSANLTRWLRLSSGCATPRHQGRGGRPLLDAPALPRHETGRQTSWCGAAP